MSVGGREEMVVARLQALAPQLDGEPDPEFRAATRARLVAMAAVRTPAPEPASRIRRLLAGGARDATRAPWQTRLTAGLAGAALTVTAAAALVAVAADAQPGDVLYGVKRGTEQTQLAVAGDSRGPTLLDFASTRLAELRSLVDAPSALPAAGAPASDGATTVLAAGADPALVLETLATMDDETRQGAEWMAARAVTERDDAPLTELAAWAAQQTDGLAALQPLVPAAAESAVGASLTLLSDITARGDALQESLTCPAGPAVQSADALGPVPTACTPDGAAPPAAGESAATPSGSQAGIPTDPARPTTPGSTSGNSAAVPTTPPVPAVPSLPTPGGGGLVPALPTLPTLPTVQPPTSAAPCLSLPGSLPSLGHC